MSFKMRKLQPDGSPHVIDCTQPTYSEIVNVVKGKCTVEKLTTRLRLKSLGYVDDESSAEDEAKPKKRFGTKKPKK